MVRRKEFSLKFTDSMLLAAEGTNTFINSKIADDIFNDPEAWSDTSIESGDDADEESEKAPVPYSAVASSKAGEFVLKPFVRRRRRASFSSVSSPEYSPPKELTVDLRRISMVLSPHFWSPSSAESPSTPSPNSGKNGNLLTPLTVTTNTLRSPAVGSPIVVSASATWSFLEWLGGTQPNTPAPAAAAPSRPAMLMVPQVTPISAASLTPRRRPLPTVPTPSTANTSSPMQPSPLQLTSPPPPPPRGGRVRRSPAPPPRIIESPPPVPALKRSLPMVQTAPLVPKSKAPIAWKAS